MQYMKLPESERENFLASLATMPDYLRESFGALTSEQAQMKGPDGGLSPVEQVWHLADLEREGFLVRITRLLSEQEPILPDFNGARIADERNYRSRSLAEGIGSFTEARQHTIEALRAIDQDSWYRAGTQEGVGRVSLCDIPSFMAQHDQAHRDEIESWKRIGHQA